MEIHLFYEYMYMFHLISEDTTMNLKEIIGIYDEIGARKDSYGNSGELTGNIKEIGYRGQG